MSVESNGMEHAATDFMHHHINMLADHVIAPYRAPDAKLDRETARSILDQLCALHRDADMVLCISAPISHFPEDLAQGRIVDASPTSDFGRLMQVAFHEPEPASLDAIDPIFIGAETPDAIENWRTRIVLPMVDFVGFKPDIEIR